METAETISVVIVEENEFLRFGWRSALDGEPDITVSGEFDTGLAAMAEMGNLKPHVVLFSVDVPDLTGYQACWLLRHVVPQARVILMTPGISPEVVISSMTAGSAGCLSKNAARSDLVDTVRRNGNGYLLLIPEVADHALRFVGNMRPLVDLGSLSRRERQVLKGLSDERSDGEVGATLGISPHTVRNHVRSICRKLKLNNRSELANYAPLLGILEEEGAPQEGDRE